MGKEFGDGSSQLQVHPLEYCSRGVEGIAGYWNIFSTRRQTVVQLMGKGRQVGIQAGNLEARAESSGSLCWGWCAPRTARTSFVRGPRTSSVSPSDNTTPMTSSKAG